MNKFLVFLIGFVIIFSSCEKERAQFDNNFSTGIFVVNQGVFQSGTGTITYRNEANDILINDLFATQNNGKVLGNIAQSMIKFDNKYFIAVNNAAKIQVVNASDFKIIGEIPIELPRYFATDGTKLYVTSYNTDLASGKINEVDTKNLTISSSINVSNLPENLLLTGDKLYVTLVSPFGQSSQDVLVVDTKSNQISKTINVGDNPNSIAKDKNGDIWVICRGNGFDPINGTLGSLHRLRDDQKVASFTLSNGANGLVVDNDGDRLYFLMDEKVMAHDISDSTFEEESIYDESINDENFDAISYQPSTNRIFLSDVKDYNSVGEILIINPETKSTGRFDSGIAPGFIYFAE
ncbi:MAG TPA: hypothetical protein PKD51_04180 [Saprospiraceae bacterium]|nr:hypothetical protein [Saprospiraceae bacterium]HMU03893.1 hypothetical protein [Saprospiraceae bacterium]